MMKPRGQRVAHPTKVQQRRRVGQHSPPTTPIGVAFYIFRQPEMISSVAVGWQAHPTAFLTFRQPEWLVFVLKTNR
ncbi:MAG: hypothetical protein IKZ88_03145 [Neisseriaceae bacterium]|nr:hypothetical protein [Neisseriaceae bacterium]